MKRARHLLKSKTRTYGIEIEAFNVDSHVVCEALNAAGIRTEVQHYNHVNHTATWKLVSDISITGSKPFELVSPILKGNKGLGQIEVVCRVLEELGAKVNKSCGLHVHHGAEDLSVAQWKVFTKVYLKHEDAFDSVQPVSRRANNNSSYCRSMNSRFNGLDDAFARIDRAETLSDLAELLSGGSRYMKLNLQSFWRHGTVEVRHHSGTIEAEKIIAWICLTQGVMEDAIGCKYARKNGTTLHDMMRNARLGVATVRFYTERQAFFAGATLGAAV